MKSSSVGIGILVCCALAVLSLAFLGCELGSADSVTRTLGVLVSGVYRHPTAGSSLVSTNSGKPIDQMQLRQTGDQLEAIDNNNKVYRGTAGMESDTLVTFNLEGQNSRGVDVTMSGNIEVSGGSATMRGTWIEPSLYATVYGVATVPTNSSPSPTTNTVQLVANKSSMAVSETVTLTASGASLYDWSASGATGTFADGDGTDGNNTWTATGSGTVTLTASDHSNSSVSDSVSVTVTP